MHIHIQPFLEQYGYGGMFLLLMLEMIGIPFPGETALTLSGVEWNAGTFSLVPLLAAAIAGNVIGSSAAYAIGRLLGRPVILRYGKVVGITEDRLSKAEKTFHAYRIPVILCSKFIAGIRVLVPYVAGIQRMSFWTFSLLNFISATIWTVVFVVLGRYLGMAWHRYHLFMHRYLWWIVLLAALAVVAAYAAARKKKAA